MYGLKKRILTKSFLISNIIIGVLILALTLVPSFINLANNNTEPVSNEVTGEVYYHINEADQEYFDEIIKHAKEQTEKNQFVWKVETKKATFDANQYYADEKYEKSVLVVFVKTNDKYSINYYDYNANTQLSSVLQTSLVELNRIIYQKETNTSYDKIENTTVIPIENENQSKKEIEKVVGSAVSSILIVPMFILVIMGIQFIGTDIIEEKSTKAIEVIIASVPPKTHFYSKIASTISFLAIQLLIILSFSMLGILINSLIGNATNSGISWGQILGDKTQMIAVTILLTILFALLGTLLYLIFGAFLASVAVNQEDYQQVQSPIMMILMIGYFVSIAANSINLPILTKILAYIPFTSALTAPGAYFSGTIGIVDVVISIIILIVTVILVTYILAPIYKASILSYDDGKLFKRIKKIIKSSRTMKVKK
ncbi:ABC-type transport system, permease component [Alteracholeplasma palmae J233]|uniref:ABC-type transport system, permease component n=2 Tax=Acholeplasma palmae TaxID=38986 RepID=U4KK67_ALTPJ|nr:ABC-type transport system, permease component [Alteracholeplasma palmae J233]